MDSGIESLSGRIAPVVAALGLELWGVERARRGGEPLLRVYIDSAAGVTIGDCERVSLQLGAMLDAEEPASGRRALEVSSPGVDRPLFAVWQYRRFEGGEVRLRTRRPVDGRRRFRGTLLGVAPDAVRLDVAGEEMAFRLADVEKANIVGSRPGTRADRAGEA